MALILRNCRLLHIPKTGGTWVRTALKSAGTTLAESGYSHNILDESPGRGMFTIAFVRHPWSWWRSYWAHKRRCKWDFQNRLDLHCMHNEFEQFMINVLDYHPGYCSEVFRSYVGPPGHEINFIGKHENLVEDLVAALRRVGEPFDEAALRATRRINVGDYGAFPTQCSDEIRVRMIEAESEAIERFGYQTSDCRSQTPVIAR